MKTLQYTTDGVLTRIAFAAEGIVRVTRTRREAFLNGESAVVVLRDGMDGALEQCDTGTVFSCDPLKVCVDRRTGALSFFNRRGDLLLKEPDRRPFQLTEKPVFLNRYDSEAEVEEAGSVDGVRAYAKPTVTYQDRVAYECRQQFV